MYQCGPIESLVRSSGLVAYGRFSAEGELKEKNPRLASLVGAHPEPVRLRDLVIPAQREDMVRLLDHQETPRAPLFVHFDRGEDDPVTLVVRWAWDGDDLVLIGEPPTVELESAQATLVKLNQRVGELARDNAKKSAGLEKDLEDLRDSHWHLQRLQELLPICSYCGRVNTGEGSWESIESYLREHSDFLTHGVCPECAKQAHTDLREQARSGARAAGEVHE